MNIFAKEEVLFDEWRVHRRGFVGDGVVDEKAYLESRPKLLFVLKEVNDLGGGGWDLREFLRDGGRSQTWNNIARWVEGIRRLDVDVPWSKLDEIDEGDRRRTLRSICAINLKKSPGHHTSIPLDVLTVAKEDEGFLHRQFQIYQADLVICCGTSDIFHKVQILEKEPEWRQTRRGIWFHEYEPDKFVIEYSHPAARCRSNLLYYGLMDAVRELQSGCA